MRLRNAAACARNVRRARPISASAAGTVTPSDSAMSTYERPSSSRIVIAERWLLGSCLMVRSSSEMLGRSVSGRASRSTTSSSGTSFGRRSAKRTRERQALCAIAISQLCGCRGRSPARSARNALRNVVCATSSASVGFQTSTSQASSSPSGTTASAYR